MNPKCRWLAAALAIACIHAHALALTIKLASLAPNGSPWDEGLRHIAAEWASLSGGKVTLKIYSGGVAGDEEDMIRKMRIGQLNAAGVTGVGMCRIFTGILAVQLPLLVRTDEELYYVLDKMKPAFESELEKKGFKVLIWSKVGWVHIFSKNPVVRPADLKKQKQFTWAGDADGVQAWKEAGFHPVPLQVTDMMSALQSGMVEAFIVSPLSAASYQWFGLAKNMTGMKWAPLIGGVVIASRTWNKIPASLRPKLLAAAEKIGKGLQSSIDKADAQALEVMKQHGLAVHSVPSDVENEWKAATRGAFAKLAGKSFDKASYEQVLMHLKAFRQNRDK